MKAIAIDQFGDIEKTVHLEDVPVPKPAPEEVLIEVRAAGVNPIDWKTAERGYGASGARFPMILGNDVAGVVVQTGSAVDRFKKGDEVYARIEHGHGGTFAEFVAVNQNVVARKPKNIDFTVAAAVPLAALAAYQSLFDYIKLQKGQKILIHAGSGGVGSFAIQFAKHAGAQVATTVGTQNVDMARSLGADWVIDYKRERFEDILKDFDAVLDTLAGDTAVRSLKVIRPGGVLASTLGVAQQLRDLRPDIRFEAIMMHPDARQLSEITHLIEINAVRPVIDRTFPLDQAKEAMLYSRSGHAHGKIVVQR